MMRWRDYSGSFTAQKGGSRAAAGAKETPRAAVSELAINRWFCVVVGQGRYHGGSNANATPRSSGVAVAAPRLANLLSQEGGPMAQ